MENKIRFFALGGLGEDGKNLYCLYINNSVFIVDAGLKYPSSDLFGVDEIIPNFNSLVRVKNLIKGIFLSHAHEDHIGAVGYILKEINIPVYASEFTLTILKNNLTLNDVDYHDFEFHEIDENSIINFEDATFSFFKVGHSIPGCLGLCINTFKGNIIYTSNFNFIQTRDGNYLTDLDKLCQIAKEGVFLLLIESLGTFTYGNDSSSFLFKTKLDSIFSNANHRIIISLFSSNLRLIQDVIDLCNQYNKKIGLRGKKGQKLVDIAIDKGLIKIDENKLYRFNEESLEENEIEDLVVLVLGVRNEPYFMLQNMYNNTDKFIRFTSDDTVIILTPPATGIEKMAAKTLDLLYRTNSNIKTIDKTLFPTTHATIEEIKMMINILKPHYIIPIIGEYRHLYTLKNIAKELDYDNNHCFVLENGDMLYVEEQKIFASHGDVGVSEILIDGTPVNDIGDQIMKDRLALSENGTLIIVAHIEQESRKLLSNIELVTKGFVYLEQSEEILASIKKRFIDITLRYLKVIKVLDSNDYRKFIKENLKEFIFDLTKRSPVIIPLSVFI
ncbi:MAG: ribonuclease J [Acholeplasmatales bacterium]|jgi:ribonuclease J|nr:ribonuclease J [Acholeplasmatales bacterium]